MEKVDMIVDINNYSIRKLDICGVCKEKYNVGDKIPRILVNCGHTYCTFCLSKYYRKSRIRCPFCKKLVKNLESVEQLPLNLPIFSHIVSINNDLLYLLDTKNENSFVGLCPIHSEKQSHFYCSFHESNFCRECIKLAHREEECCVVDLVDIKNLFELHEQNMNKNKIIVETRNKRNKQISEEFFAANS